MVACTCSSQQPLQGAPLRLHPEGTDLASYPTALPTETEVQAVLNVLGAGPKAAAGPKTASELIQPIATGRQAFVFRALAWLVKLGW